ncbi:MULTISPECIES: Na+/H+ antiporter subunit G [unclassified Xanthomonas]|uniref:Na+/H+ antiporter subunit G n=1 Tax=unclassified Xanthomonas TaxID=2643310 RepID=UPI00161833E5|nr:MULTISPECIES: Na+/H+ antiporter subunit G [unclassified Xanthomonas]MBB4131374.1 multicomponent K+:H+ antiporter subunit G [Xanthomonas sp. 3075]MBB5865213.1 multicomponent K+:H+ antiporter subunit G [Xanthomonas sp. 3058]
MIALTEYLLSALLLVGTFFILIGAFGLVKFSDFFKRLHAPTKASTLGVGCVLLASVGYHLFLGVDPQPRELLITVFLFITAPISAHLMAKAALSLMMENRPEVPNHGEMKEEGLPTPQTQGDVGENEETAKQHAEPDTDRR